MQSALLQQQALAKLRKSWAERGLPQLHVRIGMTVGRIWAGELTCNHAGNCKTHLVPTTGSVGSKSRMKYTLLGDRWGGGGSSLCVLLSGCSLISSCCSVNLASRLESLNKCYGTYIMISGALHRCVANHFVCKLLDCVSVAGRGEATMVYEVLAERTTHPAIDALLELELASLEAFKAYQNREWERAKVLYAKMGGMHGELLLERVKEFERNPPDAQWQGETVLTIK